MKEKIILVGCGEHARMVIDNLEEQGKYELFGLTTHDATELGKSIYGYPVVCLDEQIDQLILENQDINGYFLGMGHMKTRAKLFPILDRKLPAVNIVHPAAIVSKHAEIGRGVLLEAYTKVANSAKVGCHCIVNSFSAINHDQKIGNNVLIAGCVSMAGKEVGDNTIVSDGASIGFKRSVGKNCIIGDGAVVTKDLPDNVIAYGNPAKVVRANDWE